MNRNADINHAIAALILSGVEPIDALRRVLGNKNIDTMIESLYHERRAGKGIKAPQNIPTGRVFVIDGVTIQEVR